jgi:hypothetical protein
MPRLRSIGRAATYFMLATTTARALRSSCVTGDIEVLTLLHHLRAHVSNLS